MAYKNALNDMSAIAQQVWTAQTSEEKREIMLQAVAGFAAKGKDGKNVKNFQRAVRAATSPSELDRIAAQLALYPDNKVV